MIRKLVPLLALAGTLVAGGVPAASIPGLFNTGLDAQGVALAPGAVDPHYALVQSSDPSYPGPNAVASDISANGYWIANTASSRWISPAMAQGYPSGGTPHPAGPYTYRISFDLTGLDPNSALVSGQFGADNSAVIQLNGASTGGGSAGYNPLLSFALSTGFVPGVNTLDFVVTNLSAGGSNPTGIRVAGLSGTANATTGVERPDAPRALELLAPYPNPASRRTSVAFVLPRPAHVQLVVRDVTGRTVRTLAAGSYAEGRHQASWDGVGDDGTPARSGIYFVQLATPEGLASRRLAWTK
jgi:hypothetical protein